MFQSTSANTETWNYNAVGELTEADHSTNNAFDRSFQFDSIGNRKKSANSLTLPATDNYTSNALNQYDAVGVVARTFDDDGNLTDDGTKLFIWDAENRLIEVQNKSDSSTVATYAYDAYSRRITKDVAGVITNFVYDGWNPIAEFSGTTLSKSYVWGMDLSGSMQGAGGVGGLLAVNDTTATYYPTFDGNGNVSEYVNATANVVAHYEYDAFGQAVASGTKANDFSHQFSTKPLDAETGLHYYGYRYYDSSNGRWLGRDPIKEEGGFNLYGFVGNGPLNWWDILGLQSGPGLGSGNGPWGGAYPVERQHADRINITLGNKDSNCCDKKTIDAGKSKLDKGYENAYNSMRDSGIESQGNYQDTGKSSCFTQNISTVLNGLSPIPKCWTCKPVNGVTRKPLIVPGTKDEIQRHWNFRAKHGDHWWVECYSTDKDGNKSDPIIYDAYANKKGAFPAKDYDDGFNRILLPPSVIINDTPSHTLCDGSVYVPYADINK